MKLLFAAGCLEPGRSGVGDYTRLLAAACTRLGHECHLIALNDSWVSEMHEGSVHVSGSILPVVRLPERAPSSVKESALRAKLATLNPDWVSLQFVPYAFDQKGLVWPRLRWLAAVLHKRRIHVMFHEIWIGDYVGSPWKERWVGRLQKVMIRNLINCLEPTLAHTSNAIYKKMLKAAGLETRLLRMFGTIVLGNDSAESWLYPLLQSRGVPITHEARSSFWLMGFFGSIHSNFSMRELLVELKRAAHERGQWLVLLLFGNVDSGGALLVEAERTEDERLHAVSLGQQTEEKISQLLNSLDLGLTSTPLNIIGKSSSVATMLEHGLSVLAVCGETSPCSLGDEFSAGVYPRHDFFGEKRYLESFPRRRRGRVDDTARILLADLHRNSPGADCSDVTINSNIH